MSASARATVRMGSRAYEAARFSRLLGGWDDVRGMHTDSVLLPDLATLRARCWHEMRNNGYARGCVNTYADDVLGASGPTLQVRFDLPADADDADRRRFAALARRVRRDWEDWTAACDLRGREHLIELLRAGIRRLWPEGEFFLRFVTDDQAPDDRPKLRVLPIAAARIDTPPEFLSDPLVRGGVRYGPDGRRVAYYQSLGHPDDTLGPGVLRYERVPATNVIHFFVSDQPDQSRGEPLLASSLESFHLYRSFSRSVVVAARFAAQLGAALIRLKGEAPYSQATGADADEAADDDPRYFELADGQAMVLGSEADVTQLKPEQPPTTFAAFKREQLSEAFRPGAMPWIRIACDASQSSFSAARLDMNAYFHHIRALRGALERSVLGPIFARWLDEYRLLVPLPTSVRPEWAWEPPPAVDPVREAEAQARRLTALTSTLADELTAVGRDPDEHLDRLAAERRRLRELNLPDPAGTPTPAASDPAETERQEARS